MVSLKIIALHTSSCVVFPYFTLTRRAMMPLGWSDYLTGNSFPSEAPRFGVTKKNLCLRCGILGPRVRLIYRL